MRRLGILVAVMMVDTALVMALFHALAEVGQFVGVFDYEPVWQQSLYLAVSYKVARLVLS